MSTPLRLLIIESSEGDTALLVRELRRGDFNVSYQRVDTEQDIIESMASNQWDIVIAQSLPEMDSAHSISIVKSLDQDMSVIVVSADLSEEATVTAMKSGAQDFILKKNLNRLIPVVSREVREVKSRRARKQAEQTIHHMAFHDSLTGLSNRNDFERRLQLAVQSSIQLKICHTVLYLDLDQFKLINETCGHTAGDQFLANLAEELKTHIREQDGLSRLGSDEFGVLLECCSGDDALAIAKGLLSAVRGLHYSWNDKKIAVACSIGLVTVDHSAKSAMDILRCADIACYAAKDQGGNRIQHFNRNAEEFIKRRGEMQWVGRIHKAFDQNQFVLYRQDMLSMTADTADGQNKFELLLRICQPNEQVALPRAFIPAAERYNLMPQIDKWVVEKAFSYLAERVELGQSHHCFINLSAMSLSDDSFFNYIKQRMEYYKVSPESICFEITETAAISNLNKAAEFIADIKKQGFLFALDDFGSGISSFSYLKSLPVDYLKIDGGFVLNMVDDPMDCAFVDVINQLGHVAGLKTVAEYVEDEAILDKLRVMGVDYAQGYFIHAPEPT